MLIKSQTGAVNKRVLYAQAIYGDEEKKAVLKSLDNAWLASGPLVKEFETEVSKLFGKKYGVAVNSGSSANLLALKALHLPRYSSVITPACTFATTVAPIVQNLLVPQFIDVVVGRYTIDEKQIIPAIHANTKAIMVPQLIGGLCDMEYLQWVAFKYGLKLIDDSCDTLAPKIGGKTVASYADVTTTSFYGSHIITAMGMGGMVMTDSPEIRDRVIMLRDWGRYGSDAEDFETRFNFQIDSIPYDGKFLYGDQGYNMKMIEAAAAFGLEQLKRLPTFLEKRKRYHKRLTEFFKQYENWFHIPYLLDKETMDTNWLAFALTIKKEAPFNRYQILKHLETCGIQTRVLFSGNILRHPAYNNPYLEHYVALEKQNEYPVADHIMESGFLVGCHNGLEDQDIEYIISSAHTFLKSYEK